MVLWLTGGLGEMAPDRGDGGYRGRRVLLGMEGGSMTNLEREDDIFVEMEPVETHRLVALSKEAWDAHLKEDAARDEQMEQVMGYANANKGVVVERDQLRVENARLREENDSQSGEYAGLHIRYTELLEAVKATLGWWDSGALIPRDEISRLRQLIEEAEKV